MGNTPSKSNHDYHLSSHPLASSKSRHQSPQYNSDNESSSQLGQASSEHMQALPLAKWDTETSDETTGVPASADTAVTNEHEATHNIAGKHKKKMTVIKEVFTIHETVDVARASMEAVRGSPAATPGKMKEEWRMEPWGVVNDFHCEKDLVGMGGWIKDEPSRKK